MSIETAWYVVNWVWLTEAIEKDGDLDFFHHILDDDPDDRDDDGPAEDWRRYIALPEGPLWESWRAAECLADELASPAAARLIHDTQVVVRFLVGLGAVPCRERNRFFPEQAFGPPGSIDDEYLGALSPQQVREFIELGTEAASAVAKLPGSGQAIQGFEYLHALPDMVRGYTAMLNVAAERGWGVLITAS